MDTKLTSPFVLLKQAWVLATSRGHITSYLTLGTLPLLVSFTLSTLVAYTFGGADLQTIATGIITNTGGWGIVGLTATGLVTLLVVSVVGAWYTALLYKVYQATATGTLLALTTYFRPAKEVTIHLFVTYILVGVFTSVGFLLLIIPGIIIAVRYMFAPTVAAVEERAIKPIEESKQLVKGRFWKLVGRSIILVLCYNIPRAVLQAIHPWLGTVWTITSPVFGLYFFLVYLDFKGTAAVTS